MLNGTLFEDTRAWSLRDETPLHTLHYFQEHHQVEVMIDGTWTKASMAWTLTRWTPTAPGLTLAKGVKVRILNENEPSHAKGFTRPTPK